MRIVFHLEVDLHLTSYLCIKTVGSHYELSRLCPKHGSRLAHKKIYFSRIVFFCMMRHNIGRILTSNITTDPTLLYRLLLKDVQQVSHLRLMEGYA